MAGSREEVSGNLQQFVLQAKCFSQNSRLASAQPLARHHPHHREALYCIAQLIQTLFGDLCLRKKYVFSIPKQQSPCSPAKFTIQRPASASHNDTITIKKQLYKERGYTLET